MGAARNGGASRLLCEHCGLEVHVRCVSSRQCRGFDHSQIRGVGLGVSQRSDLLWSERRRRRQRRRRQWLTERPLPEPVQPLHFRLVRVVHFLVGKLPLLQTIPAPLSCERRN